MLRTSDLKPKAVSLFGPEILGKGSCTWRARLKKTRHVVRFVVRESKNEELEVPGYVFRYVAIFHIRSETDFLPEFSAATSA